MSDFWDILTSLDEAVDVSPYEGTTRSNFSAYTADDYNLNSAILRDLHDEVRATMKQPVYSNKHLDHISRLRLIPDLNWEYVHSVDELPTMLPRMMTEFQRTNTFSKCYDWDVTSLYTKYKTVIDEFLTHKEIPSKLQNLDMSKLDRDDNVQMLKHSFLTLNYITEVMNSSTIQERKELSRRVNKSEDFKYVEKSTAQTSNMFVMSFNTRWGRVDVVRGWCCFRKFQQVLTRPMILMLKDTVVARYDSMVALFIMRHIHGDSELSINKLWNFYSEGDRILLEKKNWAFDVFKLVEGVCSSRLIDLGAECRPTVVQDRTYFHYLNESIEEFQSEVVSRFFSIIQKERLSEIVCVYYSCFRHWGHPVVDCDRGLEKLNELVNKDLVVDDEFAQQLASNLAQQILTETFKKKHKWFVDVPNTDVNLKSAHRQFFKAMSENIAIPDVYVNSFKDNWHKLAILPVFQIPDHVDPSVIYDDKGHSVNRSELLEEIPKARPRTSRRVLKKALLEDVPNVKEFLTRVNEVGLPDDDLIIGLKAKERELKILARFFALMSWNLRLYFVLTEHLIKEDFLPYFPELTMSDSGTQATFKMWTALEGHGCEDVSKVTYTNGIDYQKWNNMQRHESSKHVFEVMGKLYGLPKLFTRTHEFFRDSWVYYGEKAGTLSVNEHGIPVSPPGKKYFWTGQQGGFEGLRQKGWTLLNNLVLKRILDANVTKSVVLAQGDNQIISLMFSLDTKLGQDKLQTELVKVSLKNKSIMNNIFKDVRRLGLEINRDETITSTDLLIYGKKIFFRGCRIPLYCKIFSRATCSTNDQLPSLPTIVSSVVTMALTSSQESDVGSPAMYMFVYFAIFTASNLLTHNVLARRSLIPEYLESAARGNNDRFWLTLLFLDPSLGGSGGASLTRFTSRGFPDPVTESLSFYKVMYRRNIPQEWKEVFLSFGYPPEGSVDNSMRRLIENPLSVNISKAANAINIVKDQIKDAILEASEDIANTVFRRIFREYKHYESELLAFLGSITPCFPRFNSELFAASHLGIADSLMSLFQNARTLRLCFGSRLNENIHQQLVEVEVGIVKLMNRVEHQGMWDCSATHADRLRSRWGMDIIGVTIPHPLEHLGLTVHNVAICRYDVEATPFVNVSICSEINREHTAPGPMTPYLGSSTSEGAGNFNNWERLTLSPPITQAADLRRAVGWFVPKDSLLSDTIFNNLTSLTGVEDWKSGLGLYYRSGNAIHRFNSSRQACGGFTSINTNYPSHLSVSSDPLDVGSTNYDFMFQSSILHAQYWTSEFLYHTDSYSGNHHYHQECSGCVREIKDYQLSSPRVYQFPDMSETMKLLGYNPENDKNRLSYTSPRPPPNFISMGNTMFSKTVGYSLGHFVAISLVRGEETKDLDNICTPALKMKIDPKDFLESFFDGVYNGALYKCLTRFPYTSKHRMKSQVQDSYWAVLKNVVKLPELLTMLNYEDFHVYLQSSTLSSTTKYPDNLDSLKESLLREGGRILANTLSCRPRILMVPSNWSVMKNQVIGLCITAARSLMGSSVMRSSEGHTKAQWKLYKHIMLAFLSDDPGPEIKDTSQISTDYAVQVSPLDMRSIAKSRRNMNPYMKSGPEWGRECNMGQIEFDASIEGDRGLPQVTIPDYYDSLIRGLRLPRFASGAYLKLIPMLELKERAPSVCLNLADGSGGFCSYTLRKFPDTRCYFNSLLETTGSELQGRQAGPPAGLQCLSQKSIKRCDNYDECTRYVGDLKDPVTWILIRNFARRSDPIELITVDINHDDQNGILKTLLNHSSIWKNDNIMIIYKLFVGACLSERDNPVDLLNRYFSSVRLSLPNAQSYGTKEIYAICTKPRLEPLRFFRTDQMVIDQILTHSRALNADSEGYRIELLLRVNQFQGVPSSIAPKDNDLLMSLLGRFRMAPSTQHCVIRLLRDLPDESMTLQLEILEMICICSLAPIHRSYRIPWEGLSDSELVTINSIRWARRLYVAARAREYEVIENALKTSLCKIIFTSSMDPQGGILSYRLSDERPRTSQKVITRSRDIPLESFAIRAIHLAYKSKPYDPQWKPDKRVRDFLNVRLMRINYAWEIDHIHQHTGLLPLLARTRSPCTDCIVTRYLRSRTSDQLYDLEN